MLIWYCGSYCACYFGVPDVALDAASLAFLCYSLTTDLSFRVLEELEREYPLYPVPGGGGPHDVLQVALSVHAQIPLSEISKTLKNICLVL